MLHIAIRRLPFTLGQFFKAQKSAIIYGLIQIGALWLFQWAVQSYFSNDSLPMLIGVSLLSAVTVLTAHFLIRFRDVEDIFQEFFGELKKFVRKLPLIGRWGILQKKG
jgi:hypothetical protein